MQSGCGRNPEKKNSIEYRHVLDDGNGDISLKILPQSQILYALYYKLSFVLDHHMIIMSLQWDF